MKLQRTSKSPQTMARFGKENEQARHDNNGQLLSHARNLPITLCGALYYILAAALQSRRLCHPHFIKELKKKERELATLKTFSNLAKVIQTSEYHTEIRVQVIEYCSQVSTLCVHTHTLPHTQTHSHTYSHDSIQLKR